MANIAIVGPGAIGGLVAAWLSQTGRHQLTVCARAPRGAIKLETQEGPIIEVKGSVISDPTQAEVVDWVLVATKAYDVAGTSTWLTRLVGPHTQVAILQNGVEHRERFAAVVRNEQLVPVVVDCPAERTTPTYIRQRGLGKMTVADDAAGREFVALFAGTPLQMMLTPDFKTAAWKKLCINCAGVISAILLEPAGVLRDDALAEVGRGIVRECIQVGRAEGAQLDDEIAETVIAGYRAAPADAVNSLHADRAAGRPMESDARNGVIVRKGEKHQIETPYNRMAFALLEALARRKV